MSPKRILNYYVDLSYLPKCTERFLDCVVQENIHTPSLPLPPTEGTFALNLHPHGVPIPRCACYTLPPRISVIFHLGWVPPAKILLHYTIMRNMIVPAIK